jgi:streptogramin lyase
MYLRAIIGAMVVVLLAATSSRADSLAQATSQAAQGGNDSVEWSQLGANGTTLSANFGATSNKGTTVSVSLSGPNSVLSVVCPASSCSWSGAGFASGDTLIWTSNGSNGGNGPITITFGRGQAGAGSLIQADGPSQFTATIQAFSGSTSLGSFTETSDSKGTAVYLGVVDNGGPNITSVVIGLVRSQGVTSDFAIDSLTLGSSIQGSPAPTPTAVPTSLSASDIGIGANGSVWVTASNGAIYKYDGAEFNPIPGSASRIAVDPDGNAWVVNAAGSIYRYTGSYFVNVPGTASDIGVGADGTVWVTNPSGLIYRYDGTNFQQMPGQASRIAVDPDGNAWVVNAAGSIYRYTGSYFVNVPGTASDIGVGADGTVWVTNPSGLIYRYDGTNFRQMPGQASQIAVDPNGNAWVVNAAGLIYRYTGSYFVNVPE